ncbi:MAG: CRISPR-associated protein Cas4 [Candidatus Methanoperedens sp.]|nr:CRISPR-associated protein Cas4 [Candidatus Methanoperedens sp.]
MIKVSDITAYHKCPRMCYFLGKGHELIKDISSEYIERMILKELAFKYGSVYNSDDKLSILNEELARISIEIPVIYRKELAGIDEKVFEGAFAKVRSCLEDISSNISSSGDFYACGSFQVEPVLHSEKFGLTGSPDKLININEAHFPSIIKTGKMPENGIWQSDRLQLTAYAILVEEKFNLPVERGFVEYARWGKVREVMIKRNERRMVLQIRDRIKKIHEGFMPERPKDAPCTHCGFDEICDVRSSLASRFF